MAPALESGCDVHYLITFRAYFRLYAKGSFVQNKLDAIFRGKYLENRECDVDGSGCERLYVHVEQAMA